MKLTDERLRLAYAEAQRSESRETRASCPAPDALLALVERTGSEADRLLTLDHVMSCVRCRRELDLVRAGAAAAGMPKPRAWFRSPSIGIVAMAALLLFAAGVRLYMVAGDAESGPVFRGGAGLVTHPVTTTASGDLRLAWTPVPNATSYRLEVLAAGQAVIDTTLRDTSFVVAGALTRGRPDVVWSVAAMLDDGTTANSIPARLNPRR
ncbi:MAG TPA: hypothetical protein VFZ21_27120 [Gemmatimonadaceae bacterium]|nr:hypothetical protein [Gemmatimonadaceae bacterium]